VEVDWTTTSPILSCSGVVKGMAASLVVREELRKLLTGQGGHGGPKRRCEASSPQPELGTT